MMRFSLPSFLALLSACTQAEDVTALSRSQLVGGSYGGYSYQLFVPSSYASGRPTPLVLLLHGCLQGAADFAAASGMNVVAETNGFLALYPEQRRAINPARCWQWWEPANQARGSGEVALLAGLTNHVASSYTVDPDRTYVVGFSAGGALAVLTAATYPDLFAAAVIASGLEFQAATDLSGSFNAMRRGGPDPVRQGQLAFDAMGPQARVLPVLVFHGSADGIVSTVNGHQVLSQWAQTNDLADDGSDNGSVSDVPSETRSGQVPGGRTFTHSRYRDGAGRVVLEKYIVHGMSHAWPGGRRGFYSDPRAPDGAALSWAFLRDHPRRNDSDGGVSPDLRSAEALAPAPTDRAAPN